MLIADKYSLCYTTEVIIALDITYKPCTFKIYYCKYPVVI